MIPQIGKYRILEKLGEGILGTVYKARDDGLGPPVAIRIISEAIDWDPVERSNFHRECKSLASLHHPNIAAIHEFGETKEFTYIVMEYLQGRSLRALMAEKATISEEDKLSIMTQVAEGLRHAHRCGIPHCEIRPGNIFIEPDGIVKILDIGIAHRLRPFLSRPQVVFDAPVYASPEQIAGRVSDERSEIFCCGIVFYELVTGAHPFHDEDGNKQCERILHQTHSAAADQFPDTPPGVWSVFATCLEKDPDHRYKGMGDLADGCRKVQEEMAEESELMRMALRTALPRLREAARRPGVTVELAGLLEGIESCVHREQAEYAPLSRLMRGLCQQYNVIRTASAPPSRVRLAASFQENHEGKGEDSRVTTDAGPPAGPSEAGQRQGLEEPLPTSPPEQRFSWALVASRVGRLRPRIRWQAAEHFLKRGLLRLTHMSRVAIAGVRKFGGRRIIRDAVWTCGGVLALTLVIAVAPRLRDQFLQLIHHGRGSYASRTETAPTARDGRNLSGTAQASEMVPADELIKQAQTLVDQGRFDEGRILIFKILEGDPENGSALALLKQLEQAAGARLEDQQRKDAEALLASAADQIRAGNLRSALAKIDRAEQLLPGLAEIAQVRKLWKDKNSELSRRSAEKSAADQDAARRQAAEQSWNSQAEELFRQGKYPDAEGLADRWLSEYPDSPQARQWQTASAQMRRVLQDLDSAAGEKRYREALDALMKAERINPQDPRLPGLRQQLETRIAAAKASLTVYRLGEAAIVSLDGRFVGKDGEVEDESISIGTHAVAVRNENGLSLTVQQQFVDGQHVTFVYDTANPSLRVMSDADRELVKTRREMRQVHRFELEHPHGLLRAGCRGNLLLNLVEVAYEPSAGPHGFRVPFQSLKLKVHGRTVEFFHASDNRQFQSFKSRDEKAASDLKQLWEQLEAGSKK
jgi:tetratricopeptide (TPR) repeat protein